MKHVPLKNIIKNAIRQTEEKNEDGSYNKIARPNTADIANADIEIITDWTGVTGGAPLVLAVKVGVEVGVKGAPLVAVAAMEIATLVSGDSATMMAGVMDVNEMLNLASSVEELLALTVDGFLVSSVAVFGALTVEDPQLPTKHEIKFLTPSTPFSSNLESLSQLALILEAAFSGNFFNPKGWSRLRCGSSLL